MWERLRNLRAGHRREAAAVRALVYAAAAPGGLGGPQMSITHQMNTARAAAAEQRWRIVDSVVSASGGPVSSRPELKTVLRRLNRGDADMLVVARLGCVADNPAALTDLAAKARAGDWNVVSVAEGFDLRSESGSVAVTVAAELARAQRRLGEGRTREAMAAAKAAGRRLGRPVEHSAETRRLVQEMRSSGATLQAIVDHLNVAEVPTPRGGRWHPSTVRSILHSGRLDNEAARANAETGSAGAVEHIMSGSEQHGTGTSSLTSSENAGR